jgi:hypothetical protein
MWLIDVDYNFKHELGNCRDILYTSDIVEEIGMQWEMVTGMPILQKTMIQPGDAFCATFWTKFRVPMKLVILTVIWPK